MIMKRLTPEDAVHAFLERRKMYTIDEIAYEETSMDVFLDLVSENALVTFEDTPAEAEKEPVQEGRSGTTATEQEPLQEAVEGAKPARRGRLKKVQE